MADAVAIASVVSTATLGVAGIVTQAWLTRRTFQHQRQLAIEQQRADAEKEGRATLAELARWCIELRDRLRSKPTDELLRHTRRAWELEAQLAIHLAPNMRAAVASLDAVIGRFEENHYDRLFAIGRLRAQKEEALGDEDFALASHLREEERALIEQLQPEVDAAQVELAKVMGMLHTQ
ncbi:hypothetical protein ACI792_04390 [Blastococcus sp. SYSU DS0669]